MNGMLRVLYSTPPKEPSEIWEEMLRQKQQADRLQSIGRGIEANRILRQELAPLMNHWCRVCGLPKPVQRLRLQQFLTGSENPVMATTTPAELVKPAAKAQAKPTPKRDGSRIPFDDVIAVIDSIQAEEQRLRTTLV